MSYMVDQKQRTIENEQNGQENSKVELEEERLFNKWLLKRDEDAGNQLVEKYMFLVQIIVEKMAKTLPKSISKDELKSLGLVGLYEALEKFDLSRDLKFETYASFRIRGAILDGLRKEDWLPRKTREKTKQMEAAIKDLEQKYMRPVTAEEIAEAMNISVEQVQHLLNESYFSNILSMDDYLQDQGDQEPQSFVLKDTNVKTPEEELLFSEIIGELSKAIQQLTENEQLVLSLFYKEEMTLTEIGRILDLSTSRISQIHSKAIGKLRHLLQDEGKIEP